MIFCQYIILIGSVKVWDPRQRDVPVACMEPAEGEARRDCWCVAFGNSFSDTERCVCAGYDNGDIKMFDLRTMTQRWETNIKNGVRNNIMLTENTLLSTFNSNKRNYLGVVKVKCILI